MSKGSQGVEREDNSGEDPEKKANIGELAEVYVFLHLLGAPYLHQCDEKHNRLEQCSSLPITQIVRCKGDDEEQTFVRIGEQQWLRRRSHNGKLDASSKWVDVNGEKCLSEANKMKDYLVETKVNAKACTDLARTALETLGHTRLKANSRSKEDLILRLRDVRLGKNSTLGFSVKSFLGSSPSLLNESGLNTCFCFKIDKQGYDKPLKVLNKGDTKDLINQGAKFNYVKILGDIFPQNLRYIDGQFDKLLAECVLQFYKGRKNRVKDVCEEVLKDKSLEERVLAKYQIKRLLEASALGMTPGESWDGRESANGGFIIAKKDGDIVAFLSYDRTDLLDYLYENTYFCTPGHLPNVKNINDNDKLTGHIIFDVKIRFR